ncbi:dynactin [Lenzites betulinus]|nr:dynactin [Lenzites betulinus]
MPPAEPTLGALVEVPAGRGIVRFAGATSFSAGKWIGIELYEAVGKNDGTVQGVKYFSCRPNYGVFVRPSQVKVIAAQAEPPLIPTVARAVGHQRTGSLSRTPSVRSIPSSPRAGSPSKPSISALGNGPNSPSSRPARLGSPTKRVPSLTLQPRASLVRSSSSQSDLLSPTVGRSRNNTRDSPVLEPPARLFPKAQVTPGHSPPQLSSLRHATSPKQDPPSPPPPTHAPEPEPEPDETLEPPTAKPPSRPSTPIRVVDDTELQELRAKIRVLEAKRADDARHVRELETRLNEAESFVALRPKLQAKLNQQQTELIATRRELADAQQLAQLAESRIVDTQEQLEMAMLDKEMAEERAEVAEADLEDVKERLAIAEVELEVLKEGEDGEPSGDTAVKMSLPYIQLEKQNERLKEALIRLRDISQETDQEQRRRIAEMEKDVTGLDDLQAQYESTLIKLQNAEVQIEDLKIQLDDALGAEDLLVQLTERNLMLGEKIEEMRITIEDLEALKELNDELEENHVETEKSMQEEIDAKDAQIREQARKIEALEEACQDLEGTIVQFRELVLQLQTDLDTLRAETQSAQHQSATAASQTAAVMSLNLKLQSTASKNQARHIDLEVKKIEAREARELLNIIQPYLPQIYVESDMDATNCYMFFQRLAAKVDLINSVVAQMHNLPEALNGPVSDIIVGICEMRGRLSSLSTTCKRFAAILRKCDVEAFLNIGRIFPEIAPMEKRIDMHIDLLRREEFRELECVSDAAKMQSQFDHLSETYFNNFEFDLGERELGYALSFDHDLEMFAASVGLIKTSVATVLKDNDVEVNLGSVDPEQDFFEPLQKLLDQSRSAKVLSKKLTKRFEELTQDSMALKPQLIPQLQALNNTVPELVNFGFSLAQLVMPHISDVRAAKSAFQLSTVLSFVKESAGSTVGKGRNDSPSWESVSDFLGQVIQEAGRIVPLSIEAENTLKISGSAPWVARIDEIKAATAINVEAERKVAQLNDEIQALARTLKIKDQAIQETGVKVELMERRMETVKKQADAITDLESELSKARKQERAYEEAMEQLQADLDALEQDNAKLKTLANNPERQASTTQVVEPETVPTESNLETSYLVEQIDALRGTVRFLRSENSFLKGQDLLKEIESLPELSDPFPREPTPPLVPSTQSDSESDSDDERRPPPTLRDLAVESKLLYRDVIKYTSSPRVVDLSVLRARREDGGSGAAKGWVPRKKTPAYQLFERKMQGERLGKRLKGLLEMTSHMAAA